MTIVFLKELRQAAPANVFSQEALLRGCCQALLILQLFQELDCADVTVKSVQGCTHPQVIVVDAVVDAPLGGNLRIQQRRSYLAAGPCSGRRRGNFCFSRFCLYRRKIYGVRITFLKGEHVLSGLLCKLRSQHRLPEHFIHTAFRLRLCGSFQSKEADSGCLQLIFRKVDQV